MICKNDGCNKDASRKAHGRAGYCRSCYTYAPKEKITYKKAAPGSGEKCIKEIVERSLIDPCDECIIYPYSKNKGGYGKLVYKGKDFRAHRLSLILYSGENYKDKNAAHGPCHNPSCVNPLHLYWASNKENAQDRKRDGTHFYSELHPMSKLDKELVSLIKYDLVLSTLTIDKIAKKYQISKYTVYRIKNNISWSEVEWPCDNYKELMDKKSKSNHQKANAKLDEDKVLKIKKMLNDKETIEFIANSFGVHATTIYSIKYGISWKNI